MTLYRAAASDGPFRARGPRTFVSATFSQDVAEAHFVGDVSTVEAIIVRRRVPMSCLLMSFLESEALNHPYREAEAILIGWPPSTF